VSKIVRFSSAWKLVIFIGQKEHPDNGSKQNCQKFRCCLTSGNRPTPPQCGIASVRHRERCLFGLSSSVELCSQVSGFTLFTWSLTGKLFGLHDPQNYSYSIDSTVVSTQALETQIKISNFSQFLWIFHFSHLCSLVLHFFSFPHFQKVCIWKYGINTMSLCIVAYSELR